MKIGQFSGPTTPIVHLGPKFFHSLDLGSSISNEIFILECAVIQKYHEMSFIYNYSHFQYSFCNQPVLFAQHENVNKLWNNNRIMQVNGRNQNKKMNMKNSLCVFTVIVNIYPLQLIYIHYMKFKACVRYFLSNFYFQPFKNYEKCFLFHLKSSFRSQDVQFFVIFSLPFHTVQVQKAKWKWNNL